MGKGKLLEELQALKKSKKSKSYYASRLSITVEEVDELLKELSKNTQSSHYLQVDGLGIPSYETTYTYNLEKGTAVYTSVTATARTLEELIRDHKVDSTKFKVSSYWSKQKGDKFYHSLFLSLIKPSEFNPENFALFLKGYQSPDRKIGIKRVDSKEPIHVVISIADFHLDKSTLEKDDINNRKEQYLKVLSELLTTLTSSYSVDNIVFVIGNDFYHTDNYSNSTTNLTPQDVLLSYNEAYEEGFDLMVQAVDMVRKSCKYVEVILVQGNHDRTKSFYMAHALEVYFSNDANITFVRDHSVTKHTILGNTFIGFHHGNTKIDDLPLLFATSEDSSKDFGNCKYREVHTGDKHYYLAKEIKGVRVQQMPSLSGVDRWHSDNNYKNNVRAGLALIYHHSKGKIGEIEARI